MVSTLFWSVWPGRKDDLNLQAESGTLPDGFRKWSRWHNILEKRVARIQDVLGVGSPASTLRVIVNNARATANDIVRRVQRSLSVNTTSISTSNTAEADLMSYVIPANTMVRDQDRLEIRAALTTPSLGGAAARTVKFYVGSTSMSVAAPSAATSGFDFLVTINLIRTAASSLVGIAVALSDASDVLANPIGNVTRTTFAVDLSGPVGIKLTGQTEDADAPVTQNHMSVTLVPI